LGAATKAKADGWGRSEDPGALVVSLATKCLLRRQAG
jgi:hypothetical protein